MTYRPIAAILIATALYAQTAGKPPKFEVASIKPSAPGGQGCAPPFNSPISSLQYVVRNCTVRDLVGHAFNPPKWAFVFPPQPAWLSSDRYDVIAKSAGPVNPSEHWRMLQSLLEDRFKLKWHREMRDQPVYFLSMGKGALKLPATKPGTCTAWDKKGPPPPPNPDKPPTCDYILMPGTPDGLGMGMDGTGVTMASLAGYLSGLLGRPVIDKTGNAGIFDVHFKFARDSALAFGGLPDQAGQAPDPSGLPNIFTAIRRLGLNIESGKAPVDVLVVDSAQKPSEN
jgi:uncharacterized protein (TIGR03435 family)